MKPLFIILALALLAMALSCSAQSRLSTRQLADVAVMAVPANLENEDSLKVLPEPQLRDTVRSDFFERVAFGFSSTYFWASMGSITAYRQQLIVSLMAPDASDADYAELPRRMNISYEDSRSLGSRALGSGTLTISEGRYERGSLNEPSLQFVYADRARRLQLVWHVVRKEVDLESGTAQIARMAASFRIVRDPVSWFAAMRAAPGLEAERRTSKLATAQAMLQRTLGQRLQAGQPVLHRGAYLEWMADPEPRYQLLVPLGRYRAAPEGSVVQRPRPVRDAGSGAAAAGTLGWREFSDGSWQFSNQERSYLPMAGTAALLAARQQDRRWVYFHVVATVRVAETTDESLLQQLDWFFDGLPALQQQFREGRLVAPGQPLAD